MKKINFLFFMTLSFIFMNCSSESINDSTLETQNTSSLFVDDDEGDSDLDDIIYAYIDFQDKISALDATHLQSTILEMNEAISHEDFPLARNIMLNDLQIEELEVQRLFDLINTYVDTNTAEGIEDKIQVRMKYLLCEGLLPSYSTDLCNTSQTRWWGSDCGLGSYLVAVASGVGAMVAVTGAIASGGLATGGAVIAVGLAVNTIGSLADRCS